MLKIARACTRAILWHSPWQVFVAAPRDCSAKKTHLPVKWWKLTQEVKVKLS